MIISRLSGPRTSAVSAVSAVNMLPQLRPRVLVARGDLRETAKRVEDSERTVYVRVVVVKMRGDAQASTPKCAVDAGVEQRLIDVLVLARVTVGEHYQR